VGKNGVKCGMPEPLIRPDYPSDTLLLGGTQPGSSPDCHTLPVLYY
jgi:hypothetical protein